MNGFIDSHVHVWTDNRQHYPRVAGMQEYPPDRFAPEDFLAHAAPNGVSRAVLVQMSFYGFNNYYLFDTIRDYPGVFSGIGIVDVDGQFPSLAMTLLAQFGVRGFRITGPFNRSGMEDMWRCGADRRLAMCALINPDALDELDRMCTRYPGTPVVIDHLARIGADGQVRDADVQNLCSLARHANVFVKVSAFYALGRKTAPYLDLVPMIRRVFDAYGPQRLMWGSDSPFQVQDGHTYAASVALVRDHLDFLTDDDRAWLLQHTAESLFFPS